MNIKNLIWSISLLCPLALAVRAAEPGESVVLLYNSASVDSKNIAQHYAERRHVPAEQIIGLDLPQSETMTRSDYHDKLQEPLVKFLETKKLWTFDPSKKLSDSKIRYAVLCWGVPLRIAEDAGIVESAATNLPAVIRRNGAAVDSELSLLPLCYQHLTLTGPLPNRLYFATNSQALTPTNGLLIVARLDGPTPAIASNLVDKAIEAENNDLWGRAYFDLRGLTNGPLKEGDDWIRAGEQATRRYGFETVTDDKDPTFSTNFPMSQIALYAGWYDAQVSGPFTQAPVEFMPGAIAYHLHSFSAATLRSTNQNWCGPFLASGVTATMGCVDEPQLGGTPNIGFFLNTLFHGFTFGEAAAAAQPVLSWQTTVVGDPLYRPFHHAPREIHEKLMRGKNRLIEWSHLRVINLNMAQGFPSKDNIDYLEGEPTTVISAVLSEKLGDLYETQGNLKAARQAWKQALALNPTTQQRRRLEMHKLSDGEK